VRPIGASMFCYAVNLTRYCDALIWLVYRCYLMLYLKDIKAHGYDLIYYDLTYEVFIAINIQKTCGAK
jgi:hypothetical protein